MAQLTLNKIVSYLLKLLAIFLLLAIVLTTIIIILKPKIVGIFDSVLNGTKESEPVNGTVSVQVSLPFYEELVNGYKQCKASNSTECFCQLPYVGIPENFVIELSNSQENTFIRALGGAEVVYSTFDPLTEAFVGPIEGVSEITTKEISVENDTTYFENVRGSPDIENGKLSISEFTQVNKQYLGETSLYSGSDVDGSDEIDIERGVALYKFDNKKSVLIPLDSVSGLKRCSRPAAA